MKPQPEMTCACATIPAWPRRRLLTGVGQLSAALALHAFAVARGRTSLHGGRLFEPAPSTVIIFKHSSDLDLPVLVHTLFGPHVWRAGAGRISFVARGDLYQPGFLALYFPQLGPLRRGLYRLNVGTILHRLNVLPANGTGALLVADWLDQLAARYGNDALLGDLLSATAIEQAKNVGAGGQLSLGAMRAWRYHRWLEQPAGPEIVAPSVARALRVSAAHRAMSQFEDVAARLAAGSMLVLAPEGGLSGDGTLKPFGGVLHRLLRRVPHATVLPVGISYDLPAARRPRVFVRIGARLTGLGVLSRQEGEERVRAALLQESTITLAHLASEAIQSEVAEGTGALPLAAFGANVFARCDELAQEGFAIDEHLLSPALFDRALAGFLKRARREGVTERDGQLYLDATLLRRPVSSLAGNPLGFAGNELVSILRGARGKRALIPVLGAGQR